MKVRASGQILAVVTIHREKVGGQAPIFYTESQEETAQIATYLARVFMAAIHDLGNGVYIIVKH